MTAPAPHLYARSTHAIRDGKALKAAARAIASDRLRAFKVKPEEASLEIMRALTRAALLALEEARAAYLEAKKKEEEEQASKPAEGGKAADPTEGSRSDSALSLSLLKTWAVAAVGRAALAVTQAWSALTGRGRWRWRTQRDERVRPEHRALEGRVFRTGERHPVEGLPSEAFGCRCWMEPV